MIVIGVLLTIVGVVGTVWANNYSLEDALEDVLTSFATGKNNRLEVVRFFNNYGVIMIIAGVLLIIIGVSLSKNKKK